MISDLSANTQDQAAKYDERGLKTAFVGRDQTDKRAGELLTCLYEPRIHIGCAKVKLFRSKENLIAMAFR